MKPVIWSEESIDSIQNIYDFIYSKNPQNADYVVDGIFEAGSSLNEFPEKFPIEPFLNRSDVRFFAKWSFKIIYRIETSRIYILEVFNARQNPEKMDDIEI